MGKFTVKLEGAPELQKLFADMPDKVQKCILRRAFRVAAKQIRDDAMRIVPVDSGALKKTIYIKPIKRSKTKIGILVLTPTRDELAKEQPTAEKARDVYQGDGYYPGVIEFGSSKVAAQPYMRPALENNKAITLDLVADSIRAAVEQGKDE